MQRVLKTYISWAESSIRRLWQASLLARTALREQEERKLVSHEVTTRNLLAENRRLRQQLAVTKPKFEDKKRTIARDESISTTSAGLVKRLKTHWRASASIPRPNPSTVHRERYHPTVSPTEE